MGVGILLSLVAAEFFLRIFNPQPILYVQGHPLTVSAHVPDFDGVVHSLYEKGLKKRVYFNAQGIRRPLGSRQNISYQRQPGSSYRIFFLGDSMVEAAQVDYEESMMYLLEKKLNTQAADRRYEVLSMGVGGWDQANELEYYKIEGSRFKPDMLVLFVFPHNDLDGNRVTWSSVKPIYKGKEDSFYVPRSWPQKLKIFLGSHSHFYSFLRRVSDTYTPEEQPGTFRRLLIRWRLTMRGWQEKHQIANALKTFASNAYPPEREWEVFSELLSEFQRLTAASNTRLLLVAVPWKESASPENLRRMKGVETVAEAAGISLVRLDEEFKKRGNVSDYFYKSDKHMNARGHACVAQILAEKVFEKVYS